MDVLEEIIVPFSSVNDNSVIVLSVKFSSGSYVNAGEIIAELETSKTTFTVEANHAGFIEVLCEAEQEVKINQCIFKIYSSAESIHVKSVGNVVEDALEDNPKVSNGNTFTVFSDKAEAYIIEKKISKSLFTSFDYVNVSIIEEVLGITQDINVPKKTEPKTNSAPISNQDDVVFEKLTKDKVLEIEYLSSVQQSNLTSNVTVDIDIDKTTAFLNERLKVIKNSVLPLIIFESSRLLKKHKLLNCYFENNSIAYYNEVNIGLAVDMGKGLKVLKIKNADELQLLEIEDKITELSDRYLNDTLSVDDLTKSTFTITDLSSFGVYDFYPLINKGNSGIMSISSTINSSCKVSITFDHRVTNGKYVSIFLMELKDRIESYKSARNQPAKTAIHCYKCLRQNSAESLSNSIHFLKVVDPYGNDNVLCSLCYEGF
ncbi:MAG: 2-oxo acid dehydrogenase subunit E2 [Bacteroidota bacterium]